MSTNSIYLRGTDTLVAQSIDGLFGPSEEELAQRAAAVRFLVDHTGLPYVWGGDNPRTGMDCSGAVGQAWEAAGIIPRGSGRAYSAQGLYNALPRIPASRALPGDLVFYGNWHSIHHVMMVAGDDRVIGEIDQKNGLQVRPNLNYNDRLYSVGRAPIGKVMPPPDNSARWWPIPAALLFAYGLYRFTPYSGSVQVAGLSF